ncbi:tRNA (guanosine(37)-N1)-methyltransferase TrmD [Scatolibacter rhodanostii]|uniref:tRNA (guanosine(37)-N1)-methyltransferase TrmD n=1 Tax=Scatolibacter rhodanostii TaxID=2014781 RepID=UPI000C06FB8E|nr:tRNA (guanosine(37)-N1)-methyltransferase TrmD [Scatolibacter rhodanostii]
MRIDIVTLFPEMFASTLGESIVYRARKRGYLQICCHQLRDFAPLPHRKVDDTVFGGGKGMLLAAEPIASALDAITEHVGHKPHTIYMSPRGKVLTQDKAKQLAQMDNLAILCGHYEGIDQRLLDEYVDEEISIGDFVLTGGEIPAMVLTDVVSRMIGGVLADESCFTEESHFNGLLEYPQYTRPDNWRGKMVPPVLTSGHHLNMQRWQRKESLRITKQNRPDMLAKLLLTKEDEKLLQELEYENREVK